MITKLQSDLKLLEHYQVRPNVAGLIKSAQTPTDSTSGYEQALYNVARAYIYDRAPDLKNHELGFQLVEKSEDGNKSIGVFGFKIGNIVIYIPVFYLDGKIKGTDIMFIYNLKIFVPVSQEWLETIRSSQSTIGEPTDVVRRGRTTLYPNLMQFRPNTLKWASSLPDWLQPFSPYLLLFKNRPSYINFPELRLEEILEKSASAAKEFITFFEQNPSLIKVFYDAYGPNLKTYLKIAGQTIERNIEEKKSGKTVPPADLDRAGSSHNVELYFFINDEAPQKLTKAEAEKLIKDKYIIRDFRTNKNQIYKFPQSLEGICAFTPAKPGIYQIVKWDGSTIDALVVPIINDDLAECTLNIKDTTTVHSYRNDLPKFVHAAVIPLDDNEEPTIELIKNIVALPSEKYKSRTDIEDAVAKFKQVTSFRKTPERKNEPNDSVIIFTFNEAITPFSVREVEEGKNDGTEKVIHTNNGTIIVDPTVSKIKLSKGITNGRYKEHEVVYRVPPHAKYVIVKNPDLVSVLNYDSRKYADIHRVLDLLKIRCKDKKLFKIKKASNDEYVINNKPLTWEKALSELIINYNLDEQDALKIIKEASSINFNEYLVKEADLELFPNTPTPPSTGVLPTSNPTGQVGNLTYVAPVEGFSPATTGVVHDYPSFSDPLNPRPPLDVQIRQAIQSGQKDVLNTTVFSNLLNATDDRELVEKHLPKVMQGLSAVGTLLVNLYMHYETFLERYGEEDLEKLETSLKNVFQSLGKLILLLEQRPFGMSTNYKSILGFEGNQ